ncbi:MAG: metal-dependent transcriptional regulator [Oscillospiraceae bacterium]|nr:metal-dependent transcriptional regulator [Oscillospiraceae bacterium]
MALQESGEMYLETILILSEKQGQVRSIDISEHMGYSKPSVSRAVGLLKAGNYITMEDDGHIVLTEEGRAVAQKILSRHTLLTQFLQSIGVDADTASADACKMEHVISDETFSAIKNHIEGYGSNKNTEEAKQ